MAVLNVLFSPACWRRWKIKVIFTVDEDTYSYAFSPIPIFGFHDPIHSFFFSTSRQDAHGKVMVHEVKL